MNTTATANAAHYSHFAFPDHVVVILARLDDTTDDQAVRGIAADALDEVGMHDWATFYRLMAKDGVSPAYLPHPSHETPWKFVPREGHVRVSYRLADRFPKHRHDPRGSVHSEGYDSDLYEGFFASRQSAESHLFAAWLAAGRPETLT